MLAWYDTEVKWLSQLWAAEIDRVARHESTTRPQGGTGRRNAIISCREGTTHQMMSVAETDSHPLKRNAEENTWL